MMWSHVIFERSYAFEAAGAHALEQLTVSTGVAFRMLMQERLIGARAESTTGLAKILLREWLPQSASTDGINYCAINLMSHDDFLSVG